MSTPKSSGLTETLFRPETRPAMSSSEQELTFKTNKTIFVMLVLLAVFEIIRFASKGADIIYAPTLAVSLFWTAIFLICCRKYPILFAFLATVAACLLPTSSFYIEGFAFQAVGIAFIAPIYILLITQSTVAFILTGLVHLIFINVFNKVLLAQAYQKLTPKEFLDGYLEFANPAIVLTVLVFCSMHLSVQKITGKLNESRKDSESALSQFSTFLMSFSHELRNPIHGLLGNLQLALLEKLPGPVEELVSTAKVSGELLLQLINNMLDSGKCDIGELEIKRKPTNILESSSKIWSIASELIRRKNLDCRWKIDKRIPKILMLDPYRYAQIMLNLIGNAVKFTENGHINLEMDWIEASSLQEEHFRLPFEQESLSRKSSLSVVTNISDSFDSFYHLTPNKKNIKDNAEVPEDEQEGFLRITVRDSGCGMTSEDLTKVFQKFTQVNKDEAKRQIGTGLGLYITKILVQKMNGDIKVCSQLGVGTSFVVCIPTYYSPTFGNGYDKNEAMETIKSKKLSAIVADDVQFNTTLMSFYMSKIDGTVQNTCENGVEAYNNYVNAHRKGQKINLVVADVNMPQMDGKRLCEKIRNYEKENGMSPCCIVLMSGANFDHEIDELLDKSGKYQANFFLKKPISFDECFDVIVKNYCE